MNMNCYEDLVARGLIADSSNPTLGANLANQGKAAIYMGFDATADSLHVGSLVGLLMLKRLQLAGNRVVVLLGGATTRIGDPSGKRAERPLLDLNVIDDNAMRIEHQMRQVLSFEGANPAKLVNNADWFEKINVVEFLRDVGKHFPVSQMLARDSVKLRMEQGISLTEFCYQTLQAYDFVHLYQHEGCNMQLGGTDQWGNMVAGLELIRRTCGDELGQGAVATTLPLMTTASGEKMGKTALGAVWLDERKTSCYDFYQYWINADDRDVERFLKAYTFLSISEIDLICAQDIRKAKQILAYEVTALIHGQDKANAAKLTSEAAFSNDAVLAADLPTFELKRSSLEEGITIVDLLNQTGLCSSKSDAQRLIKNGGAYFDNKRIEEPYDKFSPVLRSGVFLLKAGKKRMVRVVVNA